MRGFFLYMVLEIICKGIYDFRVDFWFIGVIIYGLYWYFNKIFVNMKQIYVMIFWVIVL